MPKVVGYRPWRGPRLTQGKDLAVQRLPGMVPQGFRTQNLRVANGRMGFAVATCNFLISTHNSILTHLMNSNSSLLKTCLQII